jgi:hypothetical protein
LDFLRLREKHPRLIQELRRILRKVRGAHDACPFITKDLRMKHIRMQYSDTFFKESVGAFGR